jgi:hypothetical protein
MDTCRSVCAAATRMSSFGRVILCGPDRALTVHLTRPPPHCRRPPGSTGQRCVRWYRTPFSPLSTSSAAANTRPLRADPDRVRQAAPQTGGLRDQAADAAVPGGEGGDRRARRRARHHRVGDFHRGPRDARTSGDPGRRASTAPIPSYSDVPCNRRSRRAGAEGSMASHAQSVGIMCSCPHRSLGNENQRNRSSAS